MSSVVSVRLPDALLRDAKKTVKLGHYTSLNELVISGIRQQLYRFMEPPAVAEVRRARREMWEEALAEAGGDEDKAVEIELKRIEKSKLLWPKHLQPNFPPAAAEAAVPGDKRRARFPAH